MTFKAFPLSEEIQKALRDLDYSTPTTVQREVVPLLLEEDQDVWVRSETGSGKTAAYVIPICEKIDWAENKPQALILTPTRELAVQVQEDVTMIGRYKRIKATAIYGKQPFQKQALQLKQKSHVVVGTPGRTIDHIERGTLALDQVKYVVLDEADEMLNMGFLEQVEEVLKALPSNRVTLLFSATLSDQVKELALNYMNEPVDIQVQPKNSTTDRIEHVQMIVKEDKKFSLLKQVTIVENPDTCIIFCKTKDQVDLVFEQLDYEQYSVDKIHGGMYQEDRLGVMEDFKMGDFRYLVATDVAARGIDVENVSLVINYDMPVEKESYVHRTGRTGRAGKEGKAITFVTPYEERFMKELEAYLQYAIPVVETPRSMIVRHMTEAFETKMERRPERKKSKRAAVDRQITKLYFNGGKKKKLRAVDFVGTLTSIEGVTAEDIGIITIFEMHTHVDILNHKGRLVLKEMKDRTVKGKKLKVYEAKK